MTVYAVRSSQMVSNGVGQSAMEKSRDLGSNPRQGAGTLQRLFA